MQLGKKYPSQWTVMKSFDVWISSPNFDANEIK